jgi:hypothetical protein
MCDYHQAKNIFYCCTLPYKNNWLITGKPSKPKGPLKVSDITSEGCKLKWNKPEDDGGEPIDHYVIERMDTDTGRWVPVGTSKTPEADVCNILIFLIISHSHKQEHSVSQTRFIYLYIYLRSVNPSTGSHH